jgi:hypothetical protein
MTPRRCAATKSVGEFAVVEDLESAHPMRLKPLPRPDAPHRGRADPYRLGHRRGAPVGRLMGRHLVRQRDDPNRRSQPAAAQFAKAGSCRGSTLGLLIRLPPASWRDGEEVGWNVWKLDP